MGQKINHQMDELQTEVTRAQEETKEQVEELERKCCGKLTEHHECLTDMERRNESTVQDIKAPKLNVRRLEENLDGTEQSMQEQIQSGMASFVSHVLPPIHARIERLETDVASSQREQLWEQRISRIETQISAQAQVKHEVFPPQVT